MALDSFKGHSIDMGRNGEGTKEGPFVEQNNILNHSLKQILTRK